MRFLRLLPAGGGAVDFKVVRGDHRPPTSDQHRQVARENGEFEFKFERQRDGREPELAPGPPRGVASGPDEWEQLVRLGEFGEQQHDADVAHAHFAEPRAHRKSAAAPGSGHVYR